MSDKTTVALCIVGKMHLLFLSHKLQHQNFVNL